MKKEINYTPLRRNKISPNKIIIFMLIILLVVWLIYSFEKNRISDTPIYNPNTNNYEPTIDINIPDIKKPAIYLYPENLQQIKVLLNFKGELSDSIPVYDKEVKGWLVTADPTGRIYHQGKEYNYIFWEGKSNRLKIDFKQGFVIEGENTADFFKSKLKEIGLVQNEIDEFIKYWNPRMSVNKFNLIQFVGKEYTEISQLKIEPQPNSILRIFMVYRPLSAKIEVKPQKFLPFERNGFTVIEWGGTEIND